MRWRTFAIGWTLTLVVLLLARPTPPASTSDTGTAIVELSYARPTTPAHAHGPAAPTAPARIVAPLVVLDVSEGVAANPAYLVTVENIARWEEAHGHIPPNAVVMAYSKVKPRWQPANDKRTGAGRFPGFSADAVHFLVEARYVYGLGTDSPEKGRSLVLPVYRRPTQ